MSGVYTGTNSAANATSLKVKITRNATLSATTADRVRFEVRNQNNTLLFTFDGDLLAGQQVYLGNDIGLSLSFTAGSLSNNHTDTTTVSHQPTDVDPNAVFNAANPNLRPRFENNAQVTAGSFTINGQTIVVAAGDSINTVVDRINGAGAGVTAAFADDRLTLTTPSASEDDIVVANDTSGFTSAVKLAGATTSRGNIRDDEQVLAKTTQFQGVTSGAFTVGGTAIAVDVAQDSLQAIVDRINAADAGVTASFNAGTGRVELVTTSDTEDAIDVANDTSGFIAAAGLDAANTVRGNLPDDQQVLSKTSQFGVVVNGTFKVNGVAIAVDADVDCLQSVVQKINATAGVSALYNQGTDRIELLADTIGDALIEVGNDTTGFLANAGLATENTVRGKLTDDLQTLDATAAFANVADGSFQINGTTIEVRAGQDTLQSLLARINASGAGVSAAYDSEADRVTMTPIAAGATLSIDEDTSGFLAAARIAEGVAATAVDPHAAFNGAGEDGPLFETGVSVTSGTFRVNGVTITVDADDSIHSVLAKITESSAGVTATFDEAAETISLVSNASNDPIIVSDDSSGFVAAVKLDTAIAETTTRSVNSLDTALGQIAEYEAVTAGVLTVNGQSIAIDPETTTVRGLVGSIDALDGVFAMLEEATGRIQISSSAYDQSVTLSDTSGVLTSWGTSEGTYAGTPGVATETLTRTRDDVTTNAEHIASKISSALEQFNTAIAALGRAGETNASTREAVISALDRVADSLREAGIEGVTVNTDGASPSLAVHHRSLVKALERAPIDTLRAAVARTFVEFSEAARDAVQARPAAAASDPSVTLSLNDRARLSAEQSQGSLLMQPFAPRPQPRRAIAAYEQIGLGLVKRDRPFSTTGGYDTSFPKPDAPVSKLGVMQPPDGGIFEWPAAHSELERFYDALLNLPNLQQFAATRAERNTGQVAEDQEASGPRTALSMLRPPINLGA